MSQDPTPAPPSKKCFVLSPIGAEGSSTRDAADKVLRHIIKKALGTAYDVQRADEDDNPGAITPRMVSSILEADLIVADLSGHNPNVFYEVAIAHGYGKPTVHIQQASDELPFDVKDMRTVKYDITDPDDVEKAQKTLRDYASAALREGATIVTPLSAAKRFAAVSASVDPVAESNVQMLEGLESVASDVRRLLRRVPPRSAPTRGLTGEQQSADRRALSTIIRRVIEGGRGEVDDWRHLINDETSPGFDDWARKQVGVLLGSTDEQDANDVLHDPTSTFLDEPDVTSPGTDEPPF